MSLRGSRGTRRGRNDGAAHTALTSDEVESLDDARGRDLLVALMITALLLGGELPNAPSRSTAGES